MGVIDAFLFENQIGQEIAYFRGDDSYPGTG